MNEYRRKYSPETYHLSDTQSVYVRLEGTTLRISHTKLRIPKRAMWNERTHKLKFYHQRIYSLEHCYLKLLPEGLTRRRWELVIYRGADKSLTQPGRKQATATDDFEFHVPYL